MFTHNAAWGKNFAVCKQTKKKNHGGATQTMSFFHVFCSQTFFFFRHSLTCLIWTATSAGGAENHEKRQYLRCRRMKAIINKNKTIGPPRQNFWQQEKRLYVIPAISNGNPKMTWFSKIDHVPSIFLPKFSTLSKILFRQYFCLEWIVENVSAFRKEIVYFWPTLQGQFISKISTKQYFNFINS